MPQSAIPFERESVVMSVVIVSICVPSAKTRTARSARTIIASVFMIRASVRYVARQPSIPVTDPTVVGPASITHSAAPASSVQPYLSRDAP